MYEVTYISLRGKVQKAIPGGDTPEQAKAITMQIYKYCASVLFVRNIYSGEVEG